MPRLTFQNANPQNDAELRNLLRQNPMQGSISVTFRREPSYFLASSVQGETANIFIARDTQTGKLAGVGACYGLTAFVNGQAQPIGYLADLRLQAAYRNGMNLRRAYDFLRSIHRQNPKKFYTTMILQDNQLALNTIAANRAGLPIYQPQGMVHTPMILLGWQKPVFQAACTIRRAHSQDWAAIVAFLNQEMARFQFAPYYRETDLTHQRLRGLAVNNIYLAIENHQIIGTLAIWEQSTFRQIHVENYASAWRWIRPIYNALSTITHLAKLPEKGAALRCAYLSLLAVRDDDVNVCRALLRTVYRDACGSGLHYLVGTLHERHPLLPVFDDYAKIDAGGYLFTVQFDDNHSNNLDNRVPYIEAARL